MPEYHYRVGGFNKVRGQFQAIKDEVTTSRRDLDLAMRKARVKHKRAPELSVQEILSPGERAKEEALKEEKKLK